MAALRYMLAAELRDLDELHERYGLGAERLACNERAAIRVYGSRLP